MSYILINRESGFIKLPLSFFSEHEDTIKQLVPNFIIEHTGRFFISLRTPARLPSHQTFSLVKKGESKTDFTCTYCKSSLKCLTNNYQCTGYSPLPHFLNDLIPFEQWAFASCAKIMYARGR